MNNADILGIILIVICAGLGIFLGFTRGLFGFLGVFFAAQFAFRADEPQKCIYIFIGGVAAALVVGFLFYGATKFTPMEAMDQVFGAIFGLLMGWGIAFFIYHYYIVVKPDSDFGALVLNGRISMYLHDISPWTQFMKKMEPFRNPDIQL